MAGLAEIGGGWLVWQWLRSGWAVSWRIIGGDVLLLYGVLSTLIFAFGVEIKTASTVSLLISLPTVLVGIIRYARQGAFANCQSLRDTVAPMGAGSVISARCWAGCWQAWRQRRGSS